MKPEELNRKIRFAVAAAQSPLDRLCDEWVFIGRESGTGRGLVLLSSGHPATEAEVRSSLMPTTGTLSVWLEDADADGHRLLVELQARGRPDVMKPPV